MLLTRNTAFLVIAALLTVTPAGAQSFDTDEPSQGGGLLQGGPGTGRPLGFSSGALLVHGNYCGPGNNGPGVPPIDALDAACMRHDSCTPDGGLPTCACNARFKREVNAIIQDPRHPRDVRDMAQTIANVIPIIACED